VHLWVVEIAMRRFAKSCGFRSRRIRAPAALRFRRKDDLQVVDSWKNFSKVCRGMVFCACSCTCRWSVRAGVRKKTTCRWSRLLDPGQVFAAYSQCCHSVQPASTQESPAGSPRERQHHSRRWHAGAFTDEANNRLGLLDQGIAFVAMLISASMCAVSLLPPNRRHRMCNSDHFSGSNIQSVVLR